MDKERLSRRGIRPVYENGWAVCFVSMCDGWKTGKCRVFFLIFCPSRTFTCWGYVQFFDICSVYLYPSINITRIKIFFDDSMITATITWILLMMKIDKCASGHRKPLVWAGSTFFDNFWYFLIDRQTDQPTNIPMRRELEAPILDSKKISYLSGCWI